MSRPANIQCNFAESLNLLESKQVWEYETGTRNNCPDVPKHTFNALQRPDDFPPINAALVSGDRVALAVDPNVPSVVEVIQGTMKALGQTEAGEIDISYSQGLTPFANFVNNGADLKMVGVAVSYAEADNCVAQGSLGVTRENAAETLVGATVMTPIGNVTHFKMLSMMEFLEVDLGERLEVFENACELRGEVGGFVSSDRKPCELCGAAHQLLVG